MKSSYKACTVAALLLLSFSVVSATPCMCCDDEALLQPIDQPMPDYDVKHSDHRPPDHPNDPKDRHQPKHGHNHGPGPLTKILRNEEGLEIYHNPDATVHEDLHIRPQPIMKCTRPGLVALTLDDGPSDLTTKVLKTLKQKSINATFFVVGTMFQDSQERKKNLQDMILQGHEIGNHELKHSNLSAIPSHQAIEDLMTMNTLFQSTIDAVPRYFRFPYGAVNLEFLQFLEEQDYKAIGWSMDPRDYELKRKDQLMNKMKKLFEKARPETDSHILLLHEIAYYSLYMYIYIYIYGNLSITNC